MSAASEARTVLDALITDPSLCNIERYRTWLGDGGPRKLLDELEEVQAWVSEILRDGGQ